MKNLMHRLISVLKDGGLRTKIDSDVLSDLNRLSEICSFLPNDDDLSSEILDILDVEDMEVSQIMFDIASFLEESGTVDRKLIGLSLRGLAEDQDSIETKMIPEGIDWRHQFTIKIDGDCRGQVDYLECPNCHNSVKMMYYDDDEDYVDDEYFVKMKCNGCGFNLKIEEIGIRVVAEPPNGLI